MKTLGMVIFYIGFFGLFVGLGALIRGNLEIVKVYNRKQALLFMVLAFAVMVIGSLIVGPPPE